MLQRLTTFVVLVSLALGSSVAFAISLRPIAATGLMQQPTSQYYHWIYGGVFDVGPTPTLSLRTSYFERPAFHSAGYVDQEFLAFAQVGGSIMQKGIFDIYGFAGGGRVWGYVREDVEPTDAYRPRRETFGMPAFALTMEAAATLGVVDLRIGHSYLLCIGSREQLDNKVAWPYTTYYLSASLPVEFGPGGKRGR